LASFSRKSLVFGEHLSIQVVAEFTQDKVHTPVDIERPFIETAHFLFGLVRRYADRHDIFLTKDHLLAIHYLSPPFFPICASERARRMVGLLSAWDSGFSIPRLPQEAL
jgi:hypothetical protein